MAVPYYGDFAEDDTVDIPFNTFTSDDPSASSTITNFINTDVHIHKDGGLTQRNNAAGITVSVDFDGITGNHLVKIDTSDDTVAEFWVTGSEYQVRIEGTTVDGATVNAWIGAFSIERAGGTIALLKLIQAAVITNAAGTDVAADIIALKAVADTIATDTTTDIPALIATAEGKIDTIDGIVDNILTDTGTTLENRLIAIEADTNELQADWTNAGRLDAILDTIAADTTTDIPALIATAQADLDIITAADGVNLTAATQASIDAIETDTTTDIPALIATAQADLDTITDTDGVIVGAAGATAIIDEFETQSQADPTGFHVNVKEVNGTAQTAGDVVALANSAAAWGYINSGIVFRGVATAGDSTHATIGGLAGQGAGAFVDAITPWYGYVFKDAGGAGAAPQGETQTISAYNNATGEFTFASAFSAAIASGDDLIIMSGRIAAIPEIKAVTDVLPDAGALTSIAQEATVAALNNIAVADITGAEVDNDGTAISLAGALKLLLAVLTGKSSGGGGATVVFRDIADAKDRISATVDANGNRTAIGTRDAT
jgi:hypothetical protein